MAYARTSLRAEQRAVREKMRAHGLSHRQIAFEFARRYSLRPRAAWRHAYGWSLKEAADRINSHAADTGLDAGGAAAMTGPHLCEYENWPGFGPDPTGRGPTPLVLTLLAATYGTAVHDLLDLADYDQMPPGDLLVLSKAAPVEVQRRLEPASRLAAITEVHAGGQGAGGSVPAMFPRSPLTRDIDHCQDREEPLPVAGLGGQGMPGR